MATQVKESKQASHWMKWDKVVKVSCKGNCSYQKPCILNAYIKDGAIVHMEQSDTHPYNNDPDFPDWNPRGCQKGLVSGLTRTYGAHRLLHPLKRAGERGSGKFEQISWDQAMTEIADTFLDVMTDEGADCIVRNFGSGTLSANESKPFNSIFTALGIASPAEIPARGDEHQGTAVVFGQPYVGGSVDNWWYADMVIIWGGNPTYTNIPNFHLLTEARYNGTQIVTVSPDYSPSSLHSDLWIPVALGSDAAEVMVGLRERGVGTRPFFLGLHEQPVLRDLGLVGPGDSPLPVTERATRQGLYLPSGLTLKESQVHEVVDALSDVLRNVNPNP